jgi:hypothetical protein
MPTYTLKCKNARGQEWEIKGVDFYDVNTTIKVGNGIKRGVMSRDFEWKCDLDKLVGAVWVGGGRRIVDITLVEEVAG